MKRNTWLILLIYGALLLIWSQCQKVGVPKAEKVFACFFSLSLWIHALSTAKTMLYAILSALSISLPMAWLLFKRPFLKSLFQSFFLILQILPMFVLAPLMILWFGWTKIAVVVPTALMMIFPLTLHALKGFQATPLEYLQFFTVHGATRKQLFLHLQMPFALPSFFAGLRVCISFAGVGAIAGEFAGAQEGIGVFLQECRRGFDVESLLGGILALLVLTASFYMAFSALEHYVCKESRQDVFS
jgi:NitT/TauT family transport system substrate-binding protein